MTNTIGASLGTVLATAQAASSAATLPDFFAGLTGVGLLVWIVIRQQREIDKLRERNRALADKCTGCELAKTANGILIEHTHLNHDESCN